MAWPSPRTAAALVAFGLLSNAALGVAPPADGPPPAVRSVGKPPTEAECLAVGEAITKAIDEGDIAAFDRAFDWDAVYQSTTGGVEAAESFRKGFVEGIEQARRANKGLSASIIQAVQKGGTYSLLRYHTKEKGPRLLFRLLSPEAGVNYHDLPLARRADGSVRVVDAYIYLSGEMISQTMRRLYIQGVAKASGGILNRLTGEDQRFLKAIGKISEMNEGLRNGKFAEVLATYKGLDPDFQKDRSILLIRLQAAQGLGDDAEYGLSIEDYRTAYPKDACIDILSIDYYTLKKEWPEALACIERLDKAVLGDPYLQVMRAGVRTEQGDFAAARADLDKAEAAEPDLIQSYWTRISIALKQKDYDETLRVLRLIRDRFQAEFADLATVPDYKGFTESPQYQQWLKDLKGDLGKDKE
ncbi:tetratricopeptide repeat protein [Tundrisphaera sp. TA3]|uniref:tetratricopeptide repeat protein n=1 Tax=Tundrisphaera sp. TA3 TaxID=3435775 RepID=UPI003EBFE835